MPSRRPFGPARDDAATVLSRSWQSVVFRRGHNRGVANAARIAPEAVAGLTDPRWRGLTIGLVLNVTFVAFEALAIATVMPLVTADLGGLALYGWTFSAFLLADLAGIVLAGELADRYGPAVPFSGGLAFFALGLLIGGLAPAMPVLIAARAVQGFGAGAIPAVAYVIIGRTYPDVLRPRMFAILSTAWIVPGIAGPVLAAFVADHVGWRWVFLGLLPLVIVAGSLAFREVRRVPAAPPRQARAVVRDAVMLAAGATFLLVGLQVVNVVLTPVLVLLGIAVAGPSFQRLVPAGTLTARRGLPAAVLARGALTFAFFAADVYVPLTVTSIRGAEIWMSGLALTGGTLAWSTGAWIQERTVLKVGAAPLVRSGFTLLAGGIAGMGLVLAGAVPTWAAVIAWGLAGLGIGMAYASISLTVLRHAPAGAEGATSSAMQLTDLLGQALGTGFGAVAVALSVANTGGPASGVAISDGLAIAGAAFGIWIAPRLTAGPR